MSNLISLTDTTDTTLAKSDLTDNLAINGFLALKKQSTAKTYSVAINQFLTHTQSDLRTINSYQVIDYQQYLKGKYKPNTVKGKMAAIKSLFSFLLKTGYITKNPLSVITLEKQPNSLAKKIVSQDSLINFLNKIDDKQYQLLFKMLYLSGARISEILDLKWCDIYRNSITVTGKTGERTIKLDQKFIDSLSVLSGRSEYVFSSNKRTALNRSNVHKKLKEFGQKYGFKTENINGKCTFSCHHFRHNSLTHQLENGANIAHLKAVAGHASANTTSVYLDLIESPDTSKFLPNF
jgi:integrase/recombinase XerD